ncbi:MAG: hypothetical protein WCI76_00075 [bacterium]
MNSYQDQLYSISSPKFWLVNDRPDSAKYLTAEDNKAHMKSLLFHVSKGDYLSTLSTVLRFFEESIKNKEITPEMTDLELKTIKIAMSDLLYLNDNYDLVLKKENKQK